MSRHSRYVDPAGYFWIVNENWLLWAVTRVTVYTFPFWNVNGEPVHEHVVEGEAGMLREGWASVVGA